MKWTKSRLLATSSFVLLNAVCTAFASETFPALTQDNKTIGIQVKIQNFTTSDAQQIKAAGFAFVRLDVWSNSLGSTAYQTQLKNAFTAASSANLPVLMTVRSLKALTSNTTDGSHDLATAGESFAQSVIDLEKTYHSQLLAIEIWNEPDLPTYWPTGNFETTFVPFMSAVCTSLNKRAASTPVIGFGFAKAPTKDSKSTIALTRILTDHPKCLNAISYHPYGMSTAEISRTQTFILDTFKLPGVASEWGVPSVSGTGGTAGQASKITNFITEIKKLNVPLFSIYEWKNNDSGSNDGERNFGLVTSDGKPKPAAIAVQAILNPQ
ncbi:glycosyl hydrolase family 5 [Pseudomonas sp. MAG733B]|uniref:glycosyl hydrolase family 5 n=1 Tax=Pseudomonas sp. MAG733B TaxID=3122079 RepID=UPI0030CD1C07